jgi:glycosyltransferase involved in cell wall biosynthesis
VSICSRYANASVPLVQQAAELGIYHLRTPFDTSLSNYRWSTLYAVSIWSIYLSRHRPDVILTLENSLIVNYLSLFLKRNGVVLLLRAGLPAKATERIKKRVHRHIDGIVVETPLQADAVRTIYASPVLAIPLLGNINSKDCDRLPFAPSDKLLTVGYVGRIESKKGVYRLLNIWKEISLSNARLIFWGYGEIQELQSHIEQLDLTRNVKVMGAYSTPEELKQIMQQIDLLVLPSEEEGFPVILMEAMAYGVPFVATDVGAVSVYGKDNPDIQIVPLNNQSIGGAIVQMTDKIRTGKIDNQRLQRYYQENYKIEKLEKRWLYAIENAWQWTR